MEIHSTITTRLSGTVPVVYRDAVSANELGERKVRGVHAYCFYQGKLLVVYADSKGYWTPPGGGVEPEETFEEAVVREVFEETNMRVLSQKLIGFQDILREEGVETQTRSVCLVEPLGDFVPSPDEEITQIKLIDPSEYKKYFDWKDVGDHIMQRALELKDHL
jgi:8-oxo-dGTP diphosphatase